MKPLALAVLALLGLTPLAVYALDGDEQPHCGYPEWTNVDGYR